MMAYNKLGFIFLIVSAALTANAAPNENALYCCGFEDSSLCDWDNLGANDFEWSGSYNPDLSDITDFLSHDSASVWFQDTNLTFGSVAIADYESPSLQLNGDDIISVEFYIHQVRPDGTYPLTIYFDDDSERSTVLTLSKRPGWNQPLTAFCGGSNLCCVTYPCTGNLRVHGVIKNPGDLLAFDNIVVNECPPPPTTAITVPPTELSTEPATTLAPTPTPPPPGPSSFCCSFETGCPTWIITGWTLSSDALPDWTNLTPFSYGSQYAWDQHADAGKIISPVIYNVQSTSTFTFNYYIYVSVPDVTNTVIVFFKEFNTTRLNYLTIISNTYAQWKPAAVECVACCTTFPCVGQIVMEASLGPGDHLYAVDNIEVNSGCVDSPKCCDFDDSDICGIVNSDSSHIWKWSGSSTPNTSFIPNFSSDGKYLYYQSFSITPETTGSVGLRTGLMSVTRNSSFEISFFVENTDEKFPLTISFQRSVDGRETIMDFVSDTYNSWASVKVYCSSLHGDCCYPDNKCDGFLKISADLSTGTNPKAAVFYAVDSINVDHECESVNQ